MKNRMRLFSAILIIISSAFNYTYYGNASELENSIKEMLTRLENGKLYPFDTAVIRFKTRSVGDGIVTEGSETHYYNGKKHSVYRTTKTQVEFERFHGQRTNQRNYY